MNFLKKGIEIIKKKEKFRLEIVVESEMRDLIRRNDIYGRLSKKLVTECIENLIENLEKNRLSFEMIMIPRQFFLVNYEIINRKLFP